MAQVRLKFVPWLLGLVLGAASLAPAQTAPYVYLQGTMQGSNGTPLPNAVINFAPTQNFYVPNSVTSVETGNLGGNVAPTGICLIPFQFYTWTTATPNPALYQCVNQAWVLLGGASVYPGAGIPLSTGAGWGTSFTVLGTGAGVVAPSGTAGAGKYVDGGTYAWTSLPANGMVWPAPGDVVISNGTNTPTGLPPQLALCLGGVAGPVFGDMPCVSSLTTTGTSGAATFNTVTGILNVPQYSTGGGGGALPSNAVLVMAGNSKLDDDSNAIEPAIALTSFTCATGTCTVINAGTNGLAAGDWVNMRFSSAWTSTFSAPTDIALSTGYTLFKIISTGLSSTQFEFSFASSGTCSSTCGSAAKATYNLPFNVNTLTGLAANPNVVIPSSVTMQGLNTFYTTILHPLSNAVTGLPTYFVLGDFENDVAASSTGCNSAATIEAAMQSLWAKIHTDTSKVVVWSDSAFSYGQTGIGACTSGYQIWIALQQWLPLQGKSAANQASGQYWDEFADVDRVLNDPTNSSLVAGNGGFTAGSVDLASAKIAQVLLSGISDPLDKRPTYFGAGPSGGLASNGFIHVPAVDAIYYEQWWDAAMDLQIFTIGSSDGYRHITVNSDTPNSFNDNTTSGANSTILSVAEKSSNSGAALLPWFSSYGTNMPTGVTPYWEFGHDATTNNTIRLQMSYGSAGGTGNFLTLGLRGTNGLKIDGAGNVVIQGILSSTAPICPNGTGGALTTSGCASGGSSPLTTKGDLYGYDTANDRVPVGTNGQILTADSTQALGVKWTTPGGPLQTCDSTLVANYQPAVCVYTLTAAQILSYDGTVATAIPMIAAPGAGRVLSINGQLMYLDYVAGTVPFGVEFEFVATLGISQVCYTSGDIDSTQATNQILFFASCNFSGPSTNYIDLPFSGYSLANMNVGSILTSTLDAGGVGYLSADTGTVNGGNTSYTVSTATAYAINANVSTVSVSVPGDESALFPGSGENLVITGSTCNDGVYPVTGSVFGAGSTVISATGLPVCVTADGNVAGGVLTYAITDGIPDSYSVASGVGTRIATGSGNNAFTINVTSLTQGNGSMKVTVQYTVYPAL